MTSVLEQPLLHRSTTSLIHVWGSRNLIPPLHLRHYMTCTIRWRGNEYLFSDGFLFKYVPFLLSLHLLPASPDCPVFRMAGFHPCIDAQIFLSTRSMLCSSCMQPWHSDRYKTCDRCRQRYTRHQHTYGLIPPTERSPPLSALSNFTDRVVCSNCARPWQSSQYKTCDRCRERAAQRAAQKRAKSDDARHSYFSDPVTSLRSRQEKMPSAPESQLASYGGPGPVPGGFEAGSRSFT
jgi:uncharacterized CHY-type Zn-finger protein